MVSGDPPTGNLKRRTSAPVSHALVIPLYGEVPLGLSTRLQRLVGAGFLVVLVDNGVRLSTSKGCVRGAWTDCVSVQNQNIGGVAGGFNRGVATALQHGATWVTLLDQDSDLRPAQLDQLRCGWSQAAQQLGTTLLLVGPRVVDAARVSGPLQPSDLELRPTRLLISSGTTFPARHWSELGPLREWLFIDFVDHEWCFRLQCQGYRLFEVSSVLLRQTFGSRHPNPVCHLLGMQLYSPERHYYGVRNLRWLVRQPHVPLDLRCKEVFKMVLKIPLWLICEPRRAENLRAVIAAFAAPLVAA